MPTPLFVRVHRTTPADLKGEALLSDPLNLFVSYVMANSTEFAFVGHDADEEVSRDHIHFVCKYSKSKETLRKKLKEIIPDIDGNTDYSMKKWDGRLKALVYMCKGSLDLWDPEYHMPWLDDLAEEKGFKGEPSAYLRSLWNSSFSENHLLYMECWLGYNPSVTGESDWTSDQKHIAIREKARKHARAYLFSKNNLIWSVSQNVKLNMLVESFFMRHPHLVGA